MTNDARTEQKPSCRHDGGFVPSGLVNIQGGKCLFYYYPPLKDILEINPLKCSFFSDGWMMTEGRHLLVRLCMALNFLYVKFVTHYNSSMDEKKAEQEDNTSPLQLMD